MKIKPVLQKSTYTCVLLSSPFLSESLEDNSTVILMLSMDNPSALKPILCKALSREQFSWFWTCTTSCSYLIFVISFTQATFFNSKFYTRKLTKNTPKTLKNFPEKSNICSFCIQSGKCYTWQNIFTRAPPMVPVTIIRYALVQGQLIKKIFMLNV